MSQKVAPSGTAGPGKGPGLTKGGGLRRQRRWRLFVFCATTGLAVGIFIAACKLMNWHLSYAWDPSNELGVQVKGCDVEIVEGATPTIGIARFAGGSRSSAVLTWDAASSSKVVNVAVRNSGACADVYQQTCAPICKITITVPPAGSSAAAAGTYGAKRILIKQDTDDEADHVTVTAVGVSVANLRADGPAIEVRYDQVRAASLAVRGVRGSVAVTDASFASGDFRSLQGSVLLRHVATPSPPYRVRWRATQASACFAGTAAHVLAPRPPWAAAPKAWSDASLSGPSTGAAWWRAQTLSHYDQDKDSMVTRAEFADGLARLPKCCGGACPVRSYCFAEEVAIFPTADGSGVADNSLAGRSGILTDSVFLTRLAGLNDTGLLPQNAMMSLDASASAGNGAAATASVKLITAGGSLRLELAPRAALSYNPNATENAAGVACLDCVARATPTPRAGTWFEPQTGRLAGLNLVGADAAKLIAIRDEFGGTAATGHLFVVIDVVAGPGVPPSRFVYTTKPIYLHITPGYLTFLSAGLLSPAVRRHRVRFANGDCGTHATDLADPTAVAARHAEIFGKLTLALVPRFQLEMRGVLVRLKPDHKPAPDSPSLETFFKVDGQWTALDYAGSARAQSLLAVYLSVAIGALLALLGAFSFVTLISQKLKRKLQADDIKARLLGQVQEPDRVKDQRFDPTQHCNPFMMPLDLVEMVLITPVRRYMVNSVTKFVNERCRVHVGEGDASRRQRRASMSAVGSLLAPVVRHGAGAAKSEEEEGSEDPSIPYDDFAAAYSEFCYHNDMKELGFKEVKRHLLLRFGTRFRARHTDRMHGIRFRDGGDAAETTVNADEHHTVEEMLYMFLHSAQCDVTERMDDSVEYDDFLLRWQLFCEKHATVAPELPDAAYEPHGLHRVEKRKFRAMQMQFLDFKGGQRAALSNRWYVLEALTVVVQMVVLWAFPLWIIIYTLSQLQYPFCQTMSVQEETCLTRYDLMAWPQRIEGRDVMAVVQFVLLTMLAIIGLAGVRMLIKYANVLSPRRALYVRYAFAAVLQIAVFGGFWYLGIVFTWFILAAILEPTAYLPYGIALATIVIVIGTTGKKLKQAALRFKAAVQGAFRKRINSAMVVARRQALERARLVRMAGRNTCAQRRLVASSAEGAAADQAESFSIGDVFELLDENGCGFLNQKEFFMVFEKLGLHGASEQKKQQAFAYCDTDGSGLISMEEFADAWDWLEEQLVEEACEDMGLSDGKVVQVVLGLLLFMGLLFAFVFVALKGWQNSGSFESVLQSMFLGGSGVLSSISRSKGKGEDASDKELGDVAELVAKGSGDSSK